MFVMSNYFTLEDYDKYIKDTSDKESRLCLINDNGEVLPVKRDDKVNDVFLMNYQTKVQQLKTRIKAIDNVTHELETIGYTSCAGDLEFYSEYIEPKLKDLKELVRVSLSGVDKLKRMVEDDLNSNSKEVEVDESTIPF